MPHLHLEYSANLALEQQLPRLLQSLNRALAAMEVAPIADIKSRATRHDAFCIADQAENGAFVHLQVRLLTGRDASVLGRLSETCMETLLDAIADAGAHRRCQISVEVLEMERSTYKKQLLDGPR